MKQVMRLVPLCLFFLIAGRFVSAGESYPRPIHPDTALVKDGAANAWVVYPSETEGYEELAGIIAAAVREKTGVELGILADTAVTEERHPVLLDEYRGRNLILLGRLGINRAVWGVYNRFLSAVDGYYPGGEGYVVRTASNVYGTGANAIIAGGSTEAGAARAVEVLSGIISGLAYEDGSLTLPWLLEVELGGECRRIFDADEIRQMERPFSEAGHAGGPGRRFYENIMSWYWSGRESYLELGLKYLDHILAHPGADGNIPLGHYGVEHFMRAYNMIDESGILSPEYIKSIDRMVVDTFHYYTWKEAPYRRGFHWEDTERIWIGRHGAASWLSDVMLIDFIIDRMPAETGELRPVHEEALGRREQYSWLFDSLLRERWRACDSHPSGDVSTSVLFRYALEKEKYEEFFDSGNARRAVEHHLARVYNPSGAALETTGKFSMYAGIVASYSGDGMLKYILEAMPGRHYMADAGGRVNAVHQYLPGAELEAIKPESLLGAQFAPMQPVHYRRQRTPVPPEKAYYFATLRGGFGREPYLLMSGGFHFLPNTLLRLVMDGHLWLGQNRMDLMGPLYYNLSGLSVSSASARERLQAVEPPPAARLDYRANASGAAFIRSVAPGYEGVDWTREIFLLGDDIIIVNDTVKALKSDGYVVTASWHPGRRVSVVGLEDGRWRLRRGDSEFMMFPYWSGGGMEFIEDADVNPVDRSSVPVYRQRMAAALGEGEQLQIANLMHAGPAGSARSFELRGAEGGLIAREDGYNSRIYYIGPMPAALGESDATAVVVGGGMVRAFAAERLSVGGRELRGGKSGSALEIEFDCTDFLEGIWAASEAGKIARADKKEWYAEDLLEREWSYGGARMPGVIESGDAGYVAQNTWDLGREVDLVRVSARRGGIPGRVMISVDGEEYSEFEGDVRDVDVLRMIHYGQVDRDENAYQAVTGKPQRARYVKVLADRRFPRGDLLFYDAGSPGAPEPLAARVTRLRECEPDILVYPDIFPGIRGGLDHLRHSVSVLDSRGEERWRREAEFPLLFVRPLDWEGKGLEQIFAGSIDNNVYVYGADGELLETLSLVDSPGLGGGRTPLATAVGLWQPDEDGRRKIVLPRYHHVSFLDRDGSFEGHKNWRTNYFNSSVLEYGIDLSGDGIEDTAAMGRDSIVLLMQDNVGADAAGARRNVPLPVRDIQQTSGSKTLAFSLYEEGEPLLFVARQNMLGILCLRRRSWLLSWVPDTGIMAAAALPGQRQILAYTREGVIWRIRLGDDLSLSGVETALADVEFTRFTVLDGARGVVIGSSPGGLFRIEPDNSSTLLAAGSFVDAAIYPDQDSPEGIVAVRADGEVEFYRLR